MNALQKIIVGLGVLVLTVVVLYPHWELAHPTEPNLVRDGGYRFVFSPPRGMMVPHVNFLELALYVGMIVGVTVAAYWLTRDRE